MSNRNIAVVLTAMLFTEPIMAAPREGLKVSWSGFQQEVSARGLKGRSAEITMAGGKIKTNLLDVTDAELVLRATRATKQWKVVNDRARIPKEQVASVRFGGRIGKGRLIGSLTGLGAGAGIAAAVVANSYVTEGPLIIVLPIIGVGIAAGSALAGYFIGRSMDQAVPDFVLTQ